MRLVDTSAWIEWLMDTPTGKVVGFRRHSSRLPSGPSPRRRAITLDDPSLTLLSSHGRERPLCLRSRSVATRSIRPLVLTGDFLFRGPIAPASNRQEPRCSGTCAVHIYTQKRKSPLSTGGSVGELRSQYPSDQAIRSSDSSGNRGSPSPNPRPRHRAPASAHWPGYGRSSGRTARSWCWRRSSSSSPRQPRWCCPSPCAR